MRHLRPHIPAVSTVICLLAGCGSDGGGADAALTPDASADSGSVDGAGPAGVDAPPRLPRLAELADGWNELHPGGATVCARGTEFTFFVHPGTVDRLLIDFIGGGVCWDARTCAVGSGTFYDSAELTRVAVAGGPLPGFGIPLDGIYNRQRDDNPFKSWHHVIIPYCTGDLHWGDARRDYGGVTIEHRGAVNARAVLDWIYQNYPAPPQIVVTGCSAGALGATLWSAHVMQHYPASQVIQFGDSEAGVITEDFYQNGFPSWNAQPAFPSWIPGLDPATRALRVPDLYIGIANHYPTNFMSQFNSAFDNAQPYFFQLMGGGDVQAWSTAMLASLATIAAGAKNFAAFVPPGQLHCVLFRQELYSVSVQGTRLIDWLGRLLATGSVASATCSPDCGQPTSP